MSGRTGRGTQDSGQVGRRRAAIAGAAHRSPTDEDVDTSRPGVRVYRSLASEDTPRPADWPYHAGLALLSAARDEAITAILAFLGKASSSDRAWLFEYNDDVTLFRNTHEWYRPGVSSHVEDLQNTPVTLMGEMQTCMAAGQPVMVTDIDRMPRSMRAMQVEFRRQDIRSTVTVPVFVDGRLRGAIGLDRTRRTGAWPDEMVPALQRVGTMIGQVQEGHRRAGHLPGRDLFPSLVYLRTVRGLRGVPLDSFALLRAERDCTNIHLSDGTAILDNRPLKWWQGVLPAAHFLRIHRSSIVRVGAIVELARKPRGGLKVLVKGLGEPVNVARPAVAELRSRLGY